MTVCLGFSVYVSPPRTQLKSYLNAFGVTNDFVLANKADNPHIPVTLRIDKRVCFVDRLDEV